MPQSTKQCQINKLFGYEIIWCVFLLFFLFGLLPTENASARNRGQERDLSTIKYIVLHSIGGPACIAGKVQYRPIPFSSDDTKFWYNYLSRSKRADIHFIIGRGGDVMPLIPIHQVAYHTILLNNESVGIELVNRGDGVESYPEVQIASLIKLLTDLIVEYPSIPISNIVRHADIDQRECYCSGKPYKRRVDPGDNFPLDDVQQKLIKIVGERPRGKPVPHISGKAPDRLCVTVDR